jgi:arylsulfatase A-like enzyme/Tfp pilus assembly protein PilF
MRRADSARWVFIAALLLSTCACRPGVGTGVRRNVVLITLDTTRADRLGCYGSKTVRTPNLDSIATGGTVFERAFAVAPITGPSHASILSGTFPPFHQVRDNDVYRVPKDLPWLPSILREHGFRTAAMVAAFPLRAGVGFARGFDYFGDHLEAPQGSLAVTNVHTLGVASRRGDRISGEFRLWLERSGGHEPFFVWLHYYDPHFPYDPPQGYADLHLDQPYDGEIAFMDDCVGTVLRALRENGLAESTALIAVADHGEGLMDHGESTHGLMLYNSTLHVPLVMRFPWIKSQQARVNTTVSSADVMPTVLDALGIAPGTTGAHIQARSLLPLISPGADPARVASYSKRPLYFETFYTYYHYGWSPLSGFILNGHKYIHAPVDELYDLDKDMAEAHGLAASAGMAAMSARFPSLQAELREGRPGSSRHEPTREEIGKLRSLGYLGGAAAVEGEALGDLSKLPAPKDHMEVYYRHNEILGLAQANRFRAALEESRAMLLADPKNKTARVMVATYSYRQGLMEVADRTWAELAHDFPDRDVLFSAGTYFQARKDFVRARQCFERLTESDPEDLEALTRLGDVTTAQGDHRGARRLYERALGIDPDYREALQGLALSLDRDGQPQAEKQFAMLASKFPFDPEVGLNYGVYLLRHGRGAEALEPLRRAAALSDGPLYAFAQFALASRYQQTGEFEKAKACLSAIELRADNPVILEKARAALAELGGK